MSVTPHLPASWGCLHVRCMHFWSGSSLFPCLYPAAIILSPSPPLPLLPLSSPREIYGAAVVNDFYRLCTRRCHPPIIFSHPSPSSPLFDFVFSSSSGTGAILRGTKDIQVINFIATADFDHPPLLFRRTLSLWGWRIIRLCS